jgi:hypothetical protein
MRGILEYRMARTRTTEIDLSAEAFDAAVAALDAVGINAAVRQPHRSGAKDSAEADAVLDVMVDVMGLVDLVQVV